MMRLIQGECIEAMHSLIDEEVKVDLVLTDPPYGTTANKNDKIIPFGEMWDCLEMLSRSSKTPFVLFGSQPFTTKLIYSNMDWFRYEWIYQKLSGGNFALVKYQPLKEHEHILVFGKKTPYYFPIMEERRGSGESRVQYGFNTTDSSDNFGITPKHNDHGNLRNPSSVRYYNNRSKGNRGLHPQQKPVELLEYLIKTYSNEGDTVLDFTMGSGSTGVACQNLNRDFIGIELDEDYFKIAKDRINQSRL